MNPAGTNFGFPGPPRLEAGVRLRRLLAVEGALAWWEATLVADGSRRVAVLCERPADVAPETGMTSSGGGEQVAEGSGRPNPENVVWPLGFAEFAEGVALSAVVEVLLEQWLPLPGEVAFHADELLVGRLAALFGAAARERESERPGFNLPLGDSELRPPQGGPGELPAFARSAGEHSTVPLQSEALERVPEFATEADLALASRIFLAEGRWWACGRLQGPAVGRLIALFAPDDPLEIAGLFASGAPADVSRPLIRAWATYLAGERHVIVRRTRRDVVAHVASQLLAVASRLWRSIPPPAVATESVISVAGRVKLSTGEIVFGGGRIEVRPARAAVRALAGAVDPAAIALRRWILAMSILRVEREMLRRR